MSAEYSDWFVEVCFRLKRETPPRMIQLKDLDHVLVKEKQGDIDVFTSVYRYPTEDPYIGPVVGGLVFDVDDAQNPENAREEAVKLVKFLISELEISEQSIDICFSGFKGFSIIVNRRVFDTQPDEKLPLIHKSMVREIAEKLGLKTIDLKIYERRRLWRLPNTRNSKNMLFKIRLTLQELESLTIDEIKRLAMQPRVLKTAGEHRISEKAKTFYLKHKAKVAEDQAKKPPVITSVSPGLGEDPPCIHLLLQGVEEGFRNQSCFTLTVYLAKQGLNLDQIRSRLLEWNENNRPPLDSNEIENTVKSAFQGVAENRYSIGCSTEILETHCNVSKCKLVEKGYIPQSLRARAEAFLKDPGLLDRVLRNSEKVFGLVRDEAVRKAVFLVGVSAYTDNSQALSLQQIHSSGRTTIMTRMLSYFDDNDVWILGKLSPTSLIHERGEWDEEKQAFIINLDCKILGFVENPTLEVLQMLRPLLSHDKRELVYKITQHIKTGRLRTITSILKGWPAFIFAGARMPATEEYKSRWLTASPEVSPDKIKKVLEKQAEMFQEPERFHPDEETETIKAAVRILREKYPIRVKVAFANLVAKHFRSRHPEDMRWFKRFLGLIQASAALHCFQREKDADGYVLASTEDLKIAYEVFKTIETSTALGLGRHLISFWLALKDRSEKLKDLDFNDAQAAFYQAFQKTISKKRLKEDWLDPLEAAGLIDLEEAAEDKRKKVIKVIEQAVALLDFGNLMRELEGA